LKSLATNFIPVAEPVLQGREREYVLECLDSGWISGSGKFVDRFEEEFARFCGARYAVTVANGTVALHLALLAAGVAPGDEVIVPDLTYVATANAVTYCGGRVVLADVDPLTWCLDPDDVKRKVTRATRAIIPVHLFGHPADMDPILNLARTCGLKVIEDAAEAHGATYKDRPVGSLGDVATFSFYGNKIITTGEGGMITTNNDQMAAQIRQLRGQGMDPRRRYWFPIVGYNYRMTNVQAAIGLAQLEHVNWFVERRRAVAAAYKHHFDRSEITLPHEAAWARNVFWLYSVCLPPRVNRDRVMLAMAERGIETRPFFFPTHVTPSYAEPDGDARYPVTTDVSSRGISLPSSASLGDEDIGMISRALLECIAHDE
jgi:perosamine synthetase